MASVKSSTKVSLRERWDNYVEDYGWFGVALPIVGAASTIFLYTTLTLAFIEAFG